MSVGTNYKLWHCVLMQYHSSLLFSSPSVDVADGVCNGDQVEVKRRKRGTLRVQKNPNPTAKDDRRPKPIT